MTYEPQRIVAPDGTEMVVIRATDFDRLVAAAAWDEDARDIYTADRALAGDEARYPAPVADSIIAGAAPLRAWREYRNLSQAELARQSGVTPTSINKLESGKRFGRLATRRAIARVLDIPVSALDPIED